MLLTSSRSFRKIHGKKVKRSKETKPSKGPLCRKYFDSKGRPRFAGTKALKESQFLISITNHFFHRFSVMLFFESCLDTNQCLRSVGSQNSSNL